VAMSADDRAGPDRRGTLANCSRLRTLVQGMGHDAFHRSYVLEALIQERTLGGVRCLRERSSPAGAETVRLRGLA
jgi:hypothetical protein